MKWDGIGWRCETEIGNITELGKAEDIRLSFPVTHSQIPCIIIFLLYYIKPHTGKKPKKP